MPLGIFCSFTCSEVCSGGFWGSFSSLHTVHTYLPVAVFVSRFQIEKYDVWGPSQQLRSSQVCNIWSLRQQRKREAKKHACLKSTMELDWDENNEPNLVCSIVWGPPTLGARGELPLLPPPVSGTGSTHKFQELSIRLDHALQWFKCVCTKQKCKEFLAFSTQSCPEVRFVIDSTSCSNKESFKHQSRDSSFSWK